MKKRLLLLSGMIACWTSVFAQAPDLIYYKFEDSSQVTNHATDPVGWLPAAISGTAYVDTGGFLGTGALTDTGGLRVPNGGVQTGWNTTVDGSFTLSFWYQPDSVQETLRYLFGDSLAGYHCVSYISNGMAAIMLMSTNSSFYAIMWIVTDPRVPHVFHMVHDGRPSKESPHGTYSTYMDGNLFSSGKMTGPMKTGSGLVIGSYAGRSGLYEDINNLDGKIDEFRWYNRALTATEIANTWDIDVSHLGDCPTFTSFTMDSISGDGAKTHWIPGSGNTSYFLEYDTAGFTPGTGTMLTGTYPSDTPNVILTGLNPETVYDIYLVEVCGSGDSVYTPVPYSFETTVPCLTPADLEISNITPSSADFDWSFLGSLEEFYLIYGSLGFDPAISGETDTAFSTSHTLQNLAEGTWYDVYLVANCGSGYISDTVHRIFKTECHPIPAPFFEDFEDSISWIPRSTRNLTIPGSVTNNNDTMNGCWMRTPSWIAGGLISMASRPFDWAVKTGGVSSPYGGLVSGQGGAGNYLYTSGDHKPDYGDEAIIYTPFIDVSTLTKPYLSFYYHRYGAYQPDLFVEVNDGKGWTTVITMKGPHQLQQTDAYDSTGIDISSFGDTVQVRFRAIYIDNGSYMGLDNFEIDEAPPVTCLEATGMVNTGTGEDTSVTIDVLGEGHSFSFEWGPVGFEQGTGCLGKGFSPFTIDSCLGLNTIQHVYIQNNCQDSGLGLSRYTGPYEFCTPFTAPYSNDFDNEILDDHPHCWKEYSRAAVAANAQGTDIFLYSGKAFSGKNVLRIYDDRVAEGDTFMALTPRFVDMNQGNKQIRFVAMAPVERIRDAENTPRELIVGSMSSYTKGSDFHPIDTITLNKNTWKEYIIQLDPATTAYNGEDQIIAFRYLTPFDPLIGVSIEDYCLIDNFHYEESSVCLPPDITTLKPVFIMDNRAEVHWTNRSGGNISLEWGDPGFTPGTGNSAGMASTSDSAYTITGLTPKTHYELYIRTDCGSSVSYWVGPLNFRTACSISAPYFEDFDGSQWLAAPGRSRIWNTTNCGDNVDDCWTRIKTCERYGTTEVYTWGVQNNVGGIISDDHGGGGNYIFPIGNSRFDTARIYSPVIDISSLNNPYLSFYYHRHGLAMPDFWVSVNNGDGQGWRKIMTITGQQQSSFTSPFRKAGIDISGYGDTVQIRFEAATREGNYGRSVWESEMGIDDVRIDEAPTCSLPESLSVDNVVDANTGEWETMLQWEDFQQLATEYEVRIGLKGFTDGGSVAGEILDTVTSEFYTIDTLLPNTCYEFIVRSLCGGDTSTFEGPFTFCTPCEPEVAPYLDSFKKSGNIQNPKESIGQNPTYQNQEFEGSTACWKGEFRLDGFGSYMWKSNFDRNLSLTSGPDHGVYDEAYAYVKSNGGEDGDIALLYSPIVDIRQLTTPELSFYYHMYGVNIDTLYLDLYDGLQWYNSVVQIGGQQQNHSYDPWKQKIVELDTFNSTGFVQARFRIKKVGSQGDIAIDEFRIGDSLTCQYPFHFRFEDSLTTESNLRWSGEVADNYAVEYGLSGYSLGEGTEIMANGDSVVIPVNDNRMYHGYIRSICGPGDTSDFVGPIQFHSKIFPCDDLEAYNAHTLDNQSALFRPWDHVKGFIYRGDEEISDKQSVSGTQSLHLYEGAVGSSGILTDIELMETGIHKVGFNILIADTGGATYEILTKEDYDVSARLFFDGMRRMCDIYIGSGLGGNVSHSFPFTGNWNRIEHIMDMDNDTTWLLVNGINIHFGWALNPNPEQGFAGLHFLTTPSNFNLSGAASDFYIDDFCVEEYECPAPSALIMEQSTCTQAMIEWTSGVDSSTAILEYDTAGFIRGSGMAFSLKANSDTLSGLTPGGNYDIYIGEICGNDTVFTGPFTIILSTEVTADFTVDEGNPTATDLTVDFDGSISTGASEYYWNFGDGSSDSIMAPSHAYTANGNYEVQLIVESDCGRDTITKTVVISGISIEENILNQSLRVYPNPTEGRIQISFETQTSESVEVSLMDLSGKIVYRRNVSDINGKFDGEIDLSNLAKGSYMLRIESGDLYAVERVVKN